jgi:hypothetical protein
MSITEIKKGIIEKVNEVNDDRILEEVYKILQTISVEKKGYVFSKLQRASLDAIDVDMDKGDFVTHEQSEKDLDEWLK